MGMINLITSSSINVRLVGCVRAHFPQRVNS